MTAIGMPEAPGRATAQSNWSVSRVRRVLLFCGIISSLVYGAADVVGGIRYAGYSFTSQAVSELMAIGAPSESLVDPLFITFGVLTLAFGLGVFRHASGRSRSLRITGALLMGYAILGFTGPTLFEMHQRGVANVDSDTPHIVLTGLLVLLTLLAMGFGAVALGKRFRAYSLGTIILLIVLGVAGAPYGARLAAGLPTPGFGIVERILIYTSLLWMSVLAIALLRRSVPHEATGAA